MIIQFRAKSNVQIITLAELDTFEQSLTGTLPSDYKQHMLQYNGGIVSPDDLVHVNYPEYTDTGLSYLLPIKYGSNTIESTIQALSAFLPSNYIPIGKNLGGGYVIMSVNSGSTYGEIKEIYPDGELNYMSPSFTQYLDDMIETPDFLK
jgi:hypothetical protein